ncbi:MAG: DUF4279 domain-containing protein, partial [Minisyncoccia bacterium]
MRLFHDDLNPKTISEQLGIRPTTAVVKGERIKPSRPPHKTGLWSCSTEHLKSTDIRVHLDHLLGLLQPVQVQLAELRSSGVTQDVFCYWATDDGQGGPELDPSQM